jgi:hypothetical protein
MNHQLIITPRTKILQLIEAYPGIEEVLIGYVPAFGKLRNPVLKNTVARVATLQQAASIANINVEDLINRLRKEVGQDLISGAADSEYVRTRPGWFSESLVKGGMDARVMLASGEHPVSQVIADLNKMEKGTIYELSAPFLPAPLIDKSTSLGLQHWVRKIDEDSYLVYFYRQ